MLYGSLIRKETALKCLAEAVNQGINYIDSADRYGIHDSELPPQDRTRAEAILGEFLKDYDRADLVIGTKVWFQLRQDVNSGGLGRKHLREGIRDSLKHLQTDYVDIYYCHRPDRETPLRETVTTMSDLIDDGLILYWGTSWWPPTLVERTIGIAKQLGAHPPHVEQPPYTPNFRYPETELFEVARHHGLGIAAFEALAGGFWTGKYRDGIPEDSRAAKTDFITEEAIEKHALTMDRMIELADGLEIGLNQLVLAWVLRRPEITTTITGASRPEQIVSNVGASGITLEKDVLEEIEGILDNTPTSPFK